MKKILLALLCLASLAWAVDIFYGASAAGKWSDGGNWKGGAAPAAGEYAVFDGDSCGAVICSLDVAVTIGGIRNTANWAGTIKQKAQTITLSDSLSHIATAGTMIFDGPTIVTGNVNLTNVGTVTTNTGAYLSHLGTGHVNLLRTQINFDSMFCANTGQKDTVSMGSGGVQVLSIGAGLYGGSMRVKPLTAKQCFYQNAASVISDASMTLYINPVNASAGLYPISRIVTYPATAGTIRFDANAASDTISQLDSVHCRSLIIASSNAAKTWRTNNKHINVYNPNVNSGIDIGNSSYPTYFQAGSSIITGLHGVLFGGADGSAANLDTVYGGTSQWYIGDRYTLSSKFYMDGTPTWTLNTNAAATLYNVGGSLYNLVLAKTAGTAVTMNDRFRCKGDLTFTSGYIIFASKARDSVAGNYTNNLSAAADTVNRNSDTLWLGGSFTGNLRVKNDLSRSYLYGTSLCNFTSNGTTVNYFDVRGDTRAKQMKLIDRYHGRKTVVTIGTLNTNGMDCFSDSFLVVQDSIATVLGDTISSNKITFGASAKPINGTPLLLYFGLALADTMRDSLPTTTSLGKMVVNKTGSNVTFANAGSYDTIQVINGSIAMNAATDTQYCDGLSITTTSACVLTAPIVVAGNITIGATANITATGVGKIISTGAGSTIALNGCTGVPPIVLNDYATFTGNATIDRLSFGAVGKKATFTAGTTITLTNLAAANWNGTSGNLDSIVSATPGTSFTMALPNAVTLEYMYFRDCHATGYTITCPWTSGCRSGGGNQ